MVHNSKRLAPQLIYKGGIFKAWNKKQAVMVHKNFYKTLPTLQSTKKSEADIAWHLYDLKLDPSENRYHLVLEEVVYTQFESALNQITKTEAGPIEDFIAKLQEKLDAKTNHPPDAPTLQDVLQEHNERVE